MPKQSEPIKLKDQLLQELKENLSYAEMQALKQAPMNPELLDKLEARFTKQQRQRKWFVTLSCIYILALFFACIILCRSFFLQGAISFGSTLLVLISFNASRAKTASKQVFIVRMLKQLDFS